MVAFQMNPRRRTNHGAPTGIGFPISHQHPFNRAGGRTFNVRQKPISTMTRQKKVRFMAGLVLLLVSALLVAYRFWWRPGIERTTCCQITRNYNGTIASFGFDNEGVDAWKSPEATIDFAERRMGFKFPKCPAGGVYHIVYGKQPYPNLPVLVCSLAKTHGHRCYRDLIGEPFPSPLDFLLNRQQRPTYEER